MQLGDLILVVDIGGGTTDFTLIAVTEQRGRTGARSAWRSASTSCWAATISISRWPASVAQRLAEKGTRIDSRQLQALWNNCRVAKEKLLEPESKAKEQPVTILGKGTGLVGGTIKATLLRERYRAACWATASSRRSPAPTCRSAAPRRACRKSGLPYAADAAITRHLARFLRQQASTARTRRGAARPERPGLPHARAVQRRRAERARWCASGFWRRWISWLAEEGMPPVKPLSGEDLMHAVARGAAYYGLARHGRGVRIRGGVPRTYYVGIESAMPAVPGLPGAAQGADGGAVRHGGRHRRRAFPDREFGLVVGEPAEFRFFTSAVAQERRSRAT